MSTRDLVVWINPTALADQPESVGRLLQSVTAEATPGETVVAVISPDRAEAERIAAGLHPTVARVQDLL